MTRPADPLVPEPVVVAAVGRESADTFTLRLRGEPPGARPFLPGQFNMLYAFGVGEVPISISGDPARPDELVHTIKDVGMVTAALCRLQKGDVVGCRGPYGSAWPIAEAAGKDVIVVAGGLGLAPVRPLVYHLRTHRSAYRRAYLLVGARTPRDLLYRRELDRWRRHQDLDVRVTVDHAGPEWTGHVGVVPALLSQVAPDPENSVAFVCGPEVMMRFTIRELRRMGIPDERIHLSLERNMKCATGFCGHCQLGPSFLCKDGPVLRFDRVRRFFWVREF